MGESQGIQPSRQGLDTVKGVALVWPTRGCRFVVSTAIFISCFGAAPAFIRSLCAQNSVPPIRSNLKDAVVLKVQGQPGGRLVFGMTAQPKSFNWVLSNDAASRQVTFQLMGDLIHVNRATQQVEPSLAKSWEVSTVRFTFPRPHGPGERAFDAIGILPRHLLETPYREGRFEKVWTLAEDPNHVVGLGAFRIRKVVPGQRVVLERNPFYWKVDERMRPLPYLEELVFEILPDQNAEYWDVPTSRRTTVLIEKS